MGKHRSQALRPCLVGLCFGLLTFSSQALAQTVSLTLPTLPAQQAGKHAPPAIAAEPILSPAPGQVTQMGGGGANMSADAAGRFVAFIRGGGEVVVRPLDGGPDRVLRMPAAEGQTFISGVATSPDGSTIAVGWGSEKDAAIFLFDRTTGGVSLRIDGPADIVGDIRFSPDGSLLATAAGGTIQLFNPKTGAEVARDAACPGRVYSVDVDRNDQLVATGCSDGQIRLYSLDRKGLRLLNSASLGVWLGIPYVPAAVRFSPDSRLLAVGMDRFIGVSIWRTSTLTKVDNLNVMKSVSNAYSVVWSADGTRIYAPSVNLKTDFKIQVWTSGRSMLPDDNGFNAMSKEYDIHFDGHGPPLGFIPLPDGRVVVATAGGAFGVGDPSGTIDWTFEANHTRYETYVADLSRPPPLNLGPDGKTVLFTFDGKTPATFDLARLAYVPASQGLSAPVTKGVAGVNVNITGILGLSDPSKRSTLNGVILPLPAKEFATAYAVAPDGQKFAISTSGSVRVFSRSGQQLWSHPGGALAVNVSRDGRYVVADRGVIRWYRLSDGKLTLSFLANADRSRWVAWTPSGYYEASAGGEDMVEWWINRGVNLAPDVFPLSRFADIMHRPDIVARALDADEQIAVQQADAAAGRKPTALAELPPAIGPHPSPVGPRPTGSKHRAAAAPKRPSPVTASVTLTETTPITPQIVARILPPVIDLVQAPATFSSASVSIRYRVRTPADAPLTGALRVLVNGLWQPQSRAVSQLSGDTQTLMISGLPARDSTVNIYADNRNGSSAPLTFSMRWASGQAGAAPSGASLAQKRKPNLYILAIGVSQYARPELRLTFADHDAEQIATALSAQQGKAYGAVTSRVLLNGQATRDAVVAGLQWLQSRAAAEDVGILFLAGHGLETSDKYYFFAPSDFDPARPRETGVDYKAIRNALTRFTGKGNRGVFLIDTCYSGALLGANTIASSGEGFALDLASSQYMVGMTSSGRDQLSLENAEWGDGAFTKALLEGIVGARADAAQSGEITMLALGGYVSQRVTRLTTNAQRPVFMAPPGGLQDFAIATH